jgi:hypothetical protein
MQADALPSGPLEAAHRTLELGLRAWIAEHTQQSVGYVEQLYTFGDLNRQLRGVHAGTRVLSIGYLALVSAVSAVASRDARWCNWYAYFPWEDWRAGEPAALREIRQQCKRWIAAASGRADREQREERVRTSFGLADDPWNEERVLERYELLYEIGLVPEAHRDKAPRRLQSLVLAHGEPMVADHRRILATAIARLRGKIKYRPVVFELLPAAFTLSQLQRTVEALAGVHLHKPNFRRLVESQGLLEETGAQVMEARGRPARLVRLRRDIARERPAVAGRLPITRRSS